MATVYVGIGTNIGEKENNLRMAVEYLNEDQLINVVNMSSVKETKPVDYSKQPDFLNQIVVIETGRNPEDLLIILKNIEERMGRERGIPKGPRVIDLDILLFDDIIHDTDDLKIPHPEILNRIFILEHLLELDPELVDPVSRVKFKEEIPRWGRMDGGEGE